MTVGAGLDQRRPPSRRQVRGWLRSLALPALPSLMTVEDFVAVVSQRVGAEVVFRRMPGMDPDMCGLTAWRRGQMLIFVDAAVSGPLFDAVMLHECVHILGDHGSVTELPADRYEAVATEMGWQAGESYRLAGRSRYDLDAEWQAEWLATYFLARMRGLHRSRWLGRGEAHSAARLLMED